METSEGVLTIDGTGTVVFANPSLGELLGYEPAALVGERFTTLLPESVRSGHWDAFQAYLASGRRQLDWSDARFDLLRADGEEVGARVSLTDHGDGDRELVTATVREVVDDDSRSSVLQRYEDIVDHLPVGVYRADYDLESPFLEVNPQLVSLLGADSAAELYERSPASFYVNDADRAETERRLAEQGYVEDQEIQLQTLSGEEFWGSVMAIVRSDADGKYIDGVVRDITERREVQRRLAERERMLSELTERSPDVLWLFDGVFEEVLFVNSAFSDVWDLPVEALDRNPVAFLEQIHPEDLPAVEEEMAGLAAGEGAEMEFRIETDDGERWLWVSGQPIVENGSVQRVVGFTRDITERKRREQTLARQRNSLERVQQITRSLRPLNTALTRASSPEEIQKAVCERLATSEAYISAWYGEYQPGEDRVTPTEWAGLDGTALSGFSVAPGAESGEPQAAAPGADAVCSSDEGATAGGGARAEGFRDPFARAVRYREVQAVNDVLTDPPSAGWREEALERGYQAAAAVPVVFGGTVYGVIGVYTARPAGFDDSERGLLRELGERVGHAMNAARSKRLLHTDTVTELELRIPEADCPHAATASALDCRIHVDGLVPAADGAVAYLSVTDAASSAVRDELLTDDRVGAARVVEATGSNGTIEHRIRDTAGTVLVEQGATVRSLLADAGEARLVAELPPDTETRSVMGAVRATAPNAEFVSKRTVDRPVADPLPETLVASLTDRQREVLAAAYRAGFFASPRHSTGDEIADSLGISSPTFYQHVRKATRTLLEQLDDHSALD
jgi:PAS domain S-box-containing protein